jgi:hypothetical protein
MVAMQEIVGAIIDREIVTNNPNVIDAARLSQRAVKYLSRADAQRIARQTRRPEWNAFATASSPLLLVDGVCYRRATGEMPIGFSLSITHSSSACCQ